MDVELPTGDVLSESRFVYGFTHQRKIKHFGPYESEIEAAEAFQKRYGYWPEKAFSTDPYANDPRDKR